ncbi:MAG: peptide-methionine (S)-S-oxide reductase MsrA [Sulfuriferula sp.]
MSQNNQRLSVATLAGGCFWCLEAVYESVHGVISVISGYMGGIGDNPSYAEVCTGNSGYAEVVRLNYDPAVIDFSQLLEVFFTIHDPTTLNRQGNDRGSQYRSAVFYHNAEQEAVAKQVIAHLQTTMTANIVTEVVAAMHFFPAEAEHQHYFARHPDQAYCVYVVAPKISKFGQRFPHWKRVSRG